MKNKDLRNFIYIFYHRYEQLKKNFFAIIFKPYQKCLHASWNRHYICLLVEWNNQCFHRVWGPGVKTGIFFCPNASFEFLRINMLIDLICWKWVAYSCFRIYFPVLNFEFSVFITEHITEILNQYALRYSFAKKNCNA